MSKHIGELPQDVLRLLRERAGELGLQAADEQGLIEAVLQHDLRVPEPLEQECRRHYDANLDGLRRGDVVQADHILYALTAATPLDALRAHAERRLHELMAGRAEFAELARSESNCPSGRLGGNLGQLGRDQCVPEFWAELLAHGAAGLLPRLVRTRFGLHIVRVQRFEPGSVPPFEAVREDIAGRLRERSLLRALRLYAEDLRRQVAA